MKKALLLLLITSGTLFGQQVGCTRLENSQFDFWVGNWNVYDRQDKKVGENRIEKQYENCLIQENWVSTAANKGTSYNYYNPADSTWNQLWVDNQGSILNLSGGFQDDRMILKSGLQTSQKGQQYYNQISWINKPDGTVHQVWEILNPAGAVLQTAFYGIYKRKEDK